VEHEKPNQYDRLRKTALEEELSLASVLKGRLAVWMKRARFMLGQSAIGPNYSKKAGWFGVLVDLDQLPIKREKKGAEKLTPRLPSARGENDAHN